MKVIILSQGTASRWIASGRDAFVPPCKYKQLIPIDNETILSRTIRQLDELEVIHPILVAHHEDFQHLGIEINELREPTGSIIQGILSLRHLWMSETEILFLLGDVAYSNSAIKEITQKVGDGTHFFGRFGGNSVTGKEAKELFALKTSGGMLDREKLYSTLLNVKNDTERPHTLKLWDLYNFWMMGFDKPNFVPIDDYTDDIDDPVHYEKFWGKMLEAINEDDRT